MKELRVEHSSLFRIKAYPLIVASGRTVDWVLGGLLTSIHWAVA